MKTKYIIYLLPFAFYLLPYIGFSQSFQWIKRGGSNENPGNESETVYSIATDSEKNYYVISKVGMSDLDVDGNLKNNFDNPGFGPQDTMLASFACNGTYRWSKVFGGGGGEVINSVVVDSQDNIYVGGSMSSCDPYPGTPSEPYPSRIDSDYFFSNTNSACTKIFFIKFTKNGVLQYVKRPQPPVSIFSGATSNTSSVSFQIQNDVIYWYLWLPPGTYADGAFTNTNTDPYTPYVLQYNLDGTFISATQLGTFQNSGSRPYIKYYRNPNNGFHYATIRKGDSSSTFAINGQPVVNSVALVCYDNNGTFLWKTENTSTAIGGVSLNDLSFDGQNNIFIAGSVTGLNMSSFLGLSHPLYGTGFLMKTNPTATNAIWTSTPSNTTSGRVSPRAIYNNGTEIAITASAGSGPTLTWSSQTTTVAGSNQGTDVLLARFNSATGACISLNKITSSTPSSDFGAAITKDASGDYIVGGGFGGALYNVNNVATWNEGGDTDFFIAKFATQPCQPLSSESFEETNIAIYPNPVQNIFTVPVKENTKYQLYTITGVLVIEGSVTTAENTISISELSSGCYVLKLQSESNKIETVKVIKEY
ncbi:T9SS type A sorting domain-containing protein [Flavobacterium sp.]|uniref:T9SS type A sorting domain-containing protein n=1 Tax=Flavobacterium sp. TaxID=239 RepID=UPI001B723BBD|nr:T9SS type A sorting domain-containing protein [Flavobacterium sp.]MBP6128029.1 T9SS type A sorting domain-containing protein [Flavobacterium sp.]